MTQTAYSASQAASVANLLSVPVWAQGTRKPDGMPFYSFTSSSRPGIIYYARQDGVSCTCPGFNNRLLCCHIIAVRERQNQESLAEGIATPGEIDVEVMSMIARRPIPTHGPRSLTDLAAQAALDTIMAKARERQAHAAAHQERGAR